jgi:tetratricopeptide (TPR) repeat protein
MNIHESRLRPVIILVILILFFFSVSSGLKAQDIKKGTINPQDFKRATVVYQKAQRLFLKGKLDEAQKKIQDCLAILPQHTSALFLSAQVLLKQNDHTGALEMMTTAKAAYPLVAEFLALNQNERLARNQEQLTSLKAQEDSLMIALTKFCVGNPGRSPLEQSLASVRGSISALSGNAQKPAIAQNELPADYHYITGNILYKLGQPAEALVEYETATRLDPTHSRAYNNMALAHFSQQRHETALSCLIRAELSGATVNADFKKTLEEKVSAANLYK